MVSRLGQAQSGSLNYLLNTYMAQRFSVLFNYTQVSIGKTVTEMIYLFQFLMSVCTK